MNTTAITPTGVGDLYEVIAVSGHTKALTMQLRDRTRPGAKRRALNFAHAAYPDRVFVVLDTRKLS